VGSSFVVASVSRFSRIVRQGRTGQGKIPFSVFVAIAGLLWIMGGGTGPTWAAPAAVQYRETLSKEAIISLTNDARVIEGLATLKENPLLDAVAEARAKDILDKQYFAHVSPTGEKASHIAEKVGYKYRVIAENLASGVFFTNSKIVDCWMRSPGHRKNILSCQMKEVGVSVVRGTLNGAKTWVSVQIFGLQSVAASDRSFTLFNQEPTVGIGTDDSARESVGEMLRRMKREVDAERNLILRDIEVRVADPKTNEELNLRIRAHNQKVDRYNQALADEKALRLAMNSRDQ
jgi:uncharacterized protein YkwD